MSRYVIRNNVHYGTVDEMVNTIKAKAAEIERLQAKLAKAEAILEREIMRVKKIQSDLPPPHKVPLYAVQGEYELMLEEMRGGQP